jgi:carboxyl-terminal processing protease
VSRRLALLLVAAAFLVGLSVNQVARAARREAAYRPLDVLAEVLTYVQNNYVDEIPERELVYGAADGVVARLDPHSAFLRPDAYRAMTEETTGEFDGVGLELTMRGDQLVVISPIADSPGERAGILPGDRILEIDGAPAREMTLHEASRRLKGPSGTRVTLLVVREGLAAPQPIAILREHIRTKSVEWRVADRERGLVVVRLKAFQDRTDRALKKALDDARAQLGGEIRGLALDLRNNPGGLLEQAVRVADRFLVEGIIVSTQGRGRGNREEERARARDTEPDYPLVLVVNKGTASASEVVAGALQDHGRAAVLGTQTFGKASVQSVIELSDRSGLKLTTARYYTPKQRLIHERGITPDIAVADGVPRGDAAVDHQLKSALDWLRAQPARRPRPAAKAAGPR